MNLKKTLLALILITSIFAFNSCSKNEEEISNEEIQNNIEQNEITLNGTLKYIGSIGYKSANYFLETTDGLVIYLTGDENEFETYKNKQVSVDGEFVEQEETDGSKSIFEVDQIKEDETQSNESKLETYEYLNQALGIKIKFSNNWSTQLEEQDSITIKYKKPDNSTQSSKIAFLPSINISFLTDTLVIKNESENIDSIEFSPLYKYTEAKHNNVALYEKKIGPDNLNSVQVKISTYNIIYYIQRNQNIYKIEFSSPANIEYDDAKNEFENIIASFQFVPINKEGESITSEKNNSTQEGNTDLAKPENEIYTKIIDIFQKDFATLTSDYTKGQYELITFEFVNENPFFYITYADNGVNKKLLISYTEDLKTFDIKAYYEEGAETDWKKISGEDNLSNLSKEIYKVNATGEVTKKIELKEGYRVFESSPYKFSLQYPSSWYFAKLEDKTYGFSDSPVESENQKIMLKIIDGSIEEYSKSTQISEEKIVLYTRRNDNETYQLQTTGEYKEFAEIMINSIQEIK